MKKKQFRQRMLIAEFIFLILIPSIFLIIAIFLINLRNPKPITQVTVPIRVTRTLKGLNPSDILTDVLYYSDKEINLHGKIVLGEKSCVSRVCDENDNCCGCDNNRDLIIRDSSIDFLNNAGEIKLFAPNRTPLCQRKENSCDYDCGDWDVGKSYEVTAKFIVVRPLGMTLSRGFFEYYLEVIDKNKVILPTQPVAAPNIFEKIIPKYLPNLFKPV